MEKSVYRLNHAFGRSLICLILLGIIGFGAVAEGELGARIVGFRVHEEPKEGRLRSFKHDDDGSIVLIADQPYTLHFFGVGLENGTSIRFTSKSKLFGAKCNANFWTAEKNLKLIDSNNALAEWRFKEHVEAEKKKYICLKTDEGWIHQGNETSLAFYLIPEPSKYLLPLWLQIMLVVFLLFLSGLFSGLNLGLMSLDLTELKIIENSGTYKEKGFAKRIYPLRKRGNLLLCTILLGNVLVNSTLTILLDNLSGSGLVAICVSTMGIVIFGEIIPQAVCSRHGLLVGARTIWITKFFMLVTFPLSFPISIILDKVLGQEIGNVYGRERLVELIKVSHNQEELPMDEVNIITGALNLRTKSVDQILTPLNDVFMIPFDSVLDFETVSKIMRHGYSRIPIFDGERDNIVALLSAKDLALVDPDDNTPVSTLCKFYNHVVHFVMDDTTLDVMLDTFKEGKTHLAFVQKVEFKSEDADPEYKTIGIVTLEDVIEEILQAEIIDETDVVTDNKEKKKRKNRTAGRDMESYVSTFSSKYLSQQMQLAAFQFCSTSLEPFLPHYITPNILKRLINHLDVAVQLNIHIETQEDLRNTPCIYEAGKQSDYFILILEGRAEVVVGKEQLAFQAGPFSYFGIPALVLDQKDCDLYSTVNDKINKSEAKSFGSEKNLLNIDEDRHSVHSEGGRSASLAGKKDARLSMQAGSENLLPLATSAFMGSGYNLPNRRESIMVENGYSSYVPDFTLRPTTNMLYLRIHRQHYLASFRASQYERLSSLDNPDKGISAAAEMYNKEVQKLSSKISRNVPGAGSDVGDSPHMRSLTPVRNRRDRTSSNRSSASDNVENMRFLPNIEETNGDRDKIAAQGDAKIVDSDDINLSTDDGAALLPSNTDPKRSVHFAKHDPEAGL